MKKISLSLIAIVVLSFFAETTRAVEPWADEKLPVTQGLALWLDAARENSSRSAKFPLVPNGRLLDIWHDASGNKRDLQQSIPNFRPKFVQTPNGYAVQFDGQDDFLSAAGPARSFTYGTVFIRALPNSNPGDLRGLLAFNASGRNDYESGLNIDLGPKKSTQLDFVSLEGAGFVGIHNFISHPAPLTNAHTFVFSLEDAESGVHLWTDSVFQGTRKREAGVSVSFDEITVGARHFSNDPEPSYVQRFFDGSIAEILVYTNLLNSGDREKIEKYLAAKYISAETEDRKLTTLVAVPNPPPVQMLVPGFSARPLPLTLSNINCIKYRSDGKLVALGYDGNIWLLTDANGDGLEDKAFPFWNKPALNAPIGMALTPSNYARGEGVFVAAKGKVSLIVDTNHDDVADEEVIVAQGWNQIWHGVDALGAAVAKDGTVYFGLGTANYTDGYLIDKTTGKSQYDLKNERGTILKVSPDFKQREIFCTGIRFPVAMAINEKGDLFCSDQEGATWLPNGNPFDELLHIEQGKHYGFPPRHPKHLPNVIDEPSVFDYSPQHQSTCGFNFNETSSGKSFGPDWWRGDVIMTGYSRGKLWRTKLFKSPAGYVAQTQLIGCLNVLTVDACVAPNGDLTVSTHSGQPDWGSGPNGIGKLYKISYNNSAPQPVAIWPASETETQIEFDRPLDPAKLKALSHQIKVMQGQSVAAGDEFEVLRPGYAVVVNQLAQPRYELKVFSTSLDADRQRLSLHTAPRNFAVNYSVTFPDFSRETTSTNNELPQNATIDLGYNLTGADVSWHSTDGKEQWNGWLPHLDLDADRTFTTGSRSEVWSLTEKSGELSLKAKLDLWQMLRPATQPGSKLDFEYPPETVTVVFKSASPLKLSASNAKVEQASANESHLTFPAKQNVWLPIELNVKTSPKTKASLQVSWFTAEDSRERALPLRRIFLPWATPQESDPKNESPRSVPEISGGNWLHGKKLFFGEQLACGKCHTVNSEGGKVGPDLSNLIHRDYASVMKDVTKPSAAINPDHVAYNVELKDGESLGGVLGEETADEVTIVDASAKVNRVAKNKIASMKSSPISLMPERLLEKLLPQETRDLFTFLLMAPPLKPATFPSPLLGNEPPAPRKLSEVQTILAAAKNKSTSAKPLRIVLCAADKDAGHNFPGFHDYPIWRERWAKLLSLADHVEIETADRWPSAKQFQTADVICFYHDNPAWAADKAADLDGFLARGGGLVFIHWSINAREATDVLSERLGNAWGLGSRFRFGAEDLNITPHEITQGFGNLKLTDETYWNLTPAAKSESAPQVLATCVEENQPRPQIWTREAGKGRVFVSIPGHFTWTFDDPLFRILLLRGISWSAHEPVDRFSDLVTVGARISE